MDFLRRYRWQLGSFFLVLSGGLAGSFSLRLGYERGAAPGPINLYLINGLLVGGLAGFYCATTVYAAKSIAGRVLYALFFAAIAFAAAFFFIAITAGGA